MCEGREPHEGKVNEQEVMSEGRGGKLKRKTECRQEQHRRATVNR